MHQQEIQQLMVDQASEDYQDPQGRRDRAVRQVSQVPPGSEARGDPQAAQDLLVNPETAESPAHPDNLPRTETLDYPDLTAELVNGQYWSLFSPH